MYQLPLPESGQITHIIHISDIHIRIGDLEKSRFNDFKQVITNLGQLMMTLPAVQQKSAVTIICGDLFNTKNKLDSFSITLFNHLIKTIVQYTPIYLIQGNHDLLQSNIDCFDVIPSLLSGHTHPSVIYLDKTGLYQAGTLGLGVVNIKETLKMGQGSGHVEQLPPFPDAHLFPSSVLYKMGLFHGTFQNSHLQNELVTHEGLPIEWVKSKGYDCLLLGDIHKRQIHPCPDWGTQFVWAYSGSMLQLDFGESCEEHGFLLWSLVEKNVKPYDIPCPSLFLNVNWSANDQQIICHLSRKNQVTLDQFLQYPNPPRHLYIKLKGESHPSTIFQLQQRLQQANITHTLIKGLVTLSDESYPPTQDQLILGTMTATATATMSHHDLTQYNTPQTWIQFIENSDTEKYLKDHHWHQWIIDPRNLCLTNLKIRHPQLMEIIKNRDIDFTMLVEKYENHRSQIQMMRKDPFVIREMKWSYILCFGPNNDFNFDQSNGHITLVAGANSTGKSSFLETILLGLYGNDIPSRRDRLGLSSIVCHKKPPEEWSTITITFSVGSIYYQINRTFEQTTGKNTLNTKKISLIQMKETIVISTSVKMINDWMTEKIGSYDQFLMSCLISQLSDADFFSLKDQDQIDLLDQSLNLNQIDLYTNVLKSNSLGLDALIKQCQTLQTYLVNDHDLSTQSQNETHERIEQLHQTIVVQKKQCDELQSIRDQIKETWHHLDSQDLLLDGEKIQEQVSHFSQLIGEMGEIENTQKLLSEKSRLTQKLTFPCPNSDVDDHLTYDHVMVELDQLRQSKQPECSRDYYQQQLVNIGEWREKHRNCLIHSSNNLSIEIAQKQLLTQTYQRQLHDHIQIKPNHSEITIEDYDQHVKMVRDIMKKIGQLPVPFDKLEHLINYCQKNPFAISAPVPDTLSKLKDTYQLATHPVIMWLAYDLPQLKRELSEKEQQEQKLSEQLNDVIQQIETQEQMIDQLSQLMDQIVDQINGLGEIVKPRKSVDDVREWLSMFKFKREKLTQRESQLTSLRELCEQNEKITVQLNEIEREVTQIEEQDFPFNPNCHACRCQPWRLRYQQLLSLKDQLTPPLDMDTMTQMRRNLDQTTQWLSEYHRCEKYLQEYIDMEKTWVQFDQKNLELTQLRDDKKNKHDQLEIAKKEVKSLRIKRKSLDHEQKNVHRVIEELSHVINHFTEWSLMKEKIIELEQYEKNRYLHDLFKQYQELNINYYHQQKTLIDANIQWSSLTHELNKHLNDNQQMITELQNNLQLVQQNDRYVQEEKEIQEQLNQWKLYQQKQQRLIQLQNWITHYQLKHIDQSLEKSYQKEHYQQQFHYWRDVLTNHQQFCKKKEVVQQLMDLSDNCQQLHVQYEKEKQMYDLVMKKIEEIQVYDQLLTQLTHRQQEINFIHKILANFRIWLYTETIIPKIVATINQIVTHITRSRDYQLKANVTLDRFNKINLNWSIETQISQMTSLSKIGGFRRNLYGLIMRVALSHMGCMINNQQLFLDEPFVSCDVDNLEKMPEFLSNLLEFYPNGIIIVSHLPTIAECSENTIHIHKNPDATSLIQFKKNETVKRKLVMKKK